MNKIKEFIADWMYVVGGIVLIVLALVAFITVLALIGNFIGAWAALTILFILVTIGLTFLYRLLRD